MGSGVNSILTSKWTKVAVFLLCLVPLAVLVWKGFHDGLGANPVQFVEHWTGNGTLRFLIITLCITPFRKILHAPQLIRFRRMLGLFAFFYACLHFPRGSGSTDSSIFPPCGRTCRGGGSSRWDLRD